MSLHASRARNLLILTGFFYDDGAEGPVSPFLLLLRLRRRRLEDATTRQPAACDCGNVSGVGGTFQFVPAGMAVLFDAGKPSSHPPLPPDSSPTNKMNKMTATTAFLGRTTRDSALLYAAGSFLLVRSDPRQSC